MMTVLITSVRGLHSVAPSCEATLKSEQVCMKAN